MTFMAYQAEHYELKQDFQKKAGCWFVPRMQPLADSREHTGHSKDTWSIFFSTRQFSQSVQNKLAKQLNKGHAVSFYAESLPGLYESRVVREMLIMDQVDGIGDGVYLAASSNLL